MQSKGQRRLFNRNHLSGSAAFFKSYFLNNSLLQEGPRACWSLVFNLLFAPSLHQSSLPLLFPIFFIFLFFPHGDLIDYHLLTSHLLINCSIVTYYEDRQICDKVQSAQVYFQAQRVYSWNVSAFVFSQMVAVMQNCSVSSLLFRVPVDRIKY